MGQHLSKTQKQNRVKYLRRRLRLYLRPTDLSLHTRTRSLVGAASLPESLPFKGRPYWNSLVKEFGYGAQLGLFGEEVPHA
jgi:hypothetical protein